MYLAELINMQTQLFIMILVGYICRKAGFITDEGNKCLTDIAVNVVIPFNILKSFLIEFNLDILTSCGLILAISTISQMAIVVFNKFAFKSYPDKQRKVLQYCVICSNAGFLGNPVCEGIYGSVGLLYASWYLVPVRLVIWSTGLSYFTNTAGQSKKEVIKKAITHPCLVSVYLGLAIMLLQIPLPGFATGVIKSIGNCNGPVTMIIIGAILAETDLRTIMNWDTIKFSVLRLAILPAIMLLGCRLLNMDAISTGVAVLLMGMPAGSTAAIFAARYDSDAPFATKCVVFTILLSMLTLPIWGMICG